MIEKLVRFNVAFKTLSWKTGSLIVRGWATWWSQIIMVVMGFSYPTTFILKPIKLWWTHVNACQGRGTPLRIHDSFIHSATFQNLEYHHMVEPIVIIIKQNKWIFFPKELHPHSLAWSTLNLSQNLFISF